ncbi:RICIN domain-containing protein [Micromonospora sp. ALFpr18c]|uniref:RICIN domain-containing protein n=1 Tax=unclassified Micromonospora TaxID=2617518 RepID=UPI00124B0889|nr:RICIN domain-containing protein [Micromonospora sp. ALFpr18c]KAB1926886.1 RICIN domain-containing protein [Micromonospora sp. ALFpr18c]
MRLRTFAAVFTALVGIAAGGMVAPSAAYAADNGPWEVFPASAVDKCLEVQGGSTALSAQVQVYTCATWDGGVTPLHQRWIFRPTSGGYQRIINGKTGMCANIKGSTDVNSTKIVQYNCGGSGTLNDQWYPQFVRKIGGFDFYQFKSRLNPAKCLNVQGSTTSNGSDLILYTCATTNNAIFSWTPAVQA